MTICLQYEDDVAWDEETPLVTYYAESTKESGEDASRA